MTICTRVRITNDLPISRLPEIVEKIERLKREPPLGANSQRRVIVVDVTGQGCVRAYKIREPYTWVPGGNDSVKVRSGVHEKVYHPDEL